SNEHVDKVTDDDEQLTVGCEKTSTNDEVDEDNPTSSIVYVHVSDVKISGDKKLNNNLCKNKKLTNGQQFRQGSCSQTIQGEIPSVNKMPSTLIIEPINGQILKSQQSFRVKTKTSNLITGFFTDPNEKYYAEPQLLKNGVIKGHSHVTIQKLDGNNLPDAKDFAFFKGLDQPDKNGILSVKVKGLSPGDYRICTLVSSFSHQPVIMPVAKRGSQDDYDMGRTGRMLMADNLNFDPIDEFSSGVDVNAAMFMSIGGQDKNLLIIFGGFSKRKAPPNPLYIFNTTSKSKSLAFKEVIPECTGRVLHTSVTKYDSKVFILGGSSLPVVEKTSVGDALNTLCVYDSLTDTFKMSPINTTLGVTPSPRRGHRAVGTTDKKIIIYGGCKNAKIIYDDVLELDTTTLAWKTIQPLGITKLPGLFDNTMTMVGTNIIIAYGK
ncbi:3440_t:CDS:2, partial [Entrophospora sp. SA101]